VVVSPGRQGLSLSLSSQQAPAPPTPYSRAISNEHEIQALHPHVSVVSSGDEIRLSGNSPPSVSAVSNGVSCMQNMVLGSKYLRATQELLDEVANVGKDLIKSGIIARTKEKMKMTKESITGDGSDGSGEAVGETSAKRGADLTTAHRQELQMKKAKLVTMLDEVRTCISVCMCACVCVCVKQVAYFCGCFPLMAALDFLPVKIENITRFPFKCYM
jgi:hypothetical protein